MNTDLLMQLFLKHYKFTTIYFVNLRDSALIQSVNLFCRTTANIMSYLIHSYFAN